MAKDLARIKRNVRKMAEQNAPEQDIDGYIASEGVTIDDIRSFSDSAEQSRLRGEEGEYTAFGQGFANGVPIVGPWLKERYLDADAWLDTHLPTSMVGRDTTGQTWEEARKYSEEAGKQSKEYHPYAATAGELTGAAAGTGALMALPGGAIATGARSIPGLTGGLGFATRVGLGGATGTALGGADAAVRGEDVEQGMLTGGAFGALGPAAAPLVSNVVQKGLSKLGLAPNRVGGKELYTAAKEYNDTVGGNQIPKILKENIPGIEDTPSSHQIQEYLHHHPIPLPIDEDRTLAELNRIARSPGKGRDVIEDVYGSSVSQAKREVGGLADWFTPQAGDSKGIKAQKQFFQDKLIDFGGDHDKAYQFFKRQANQRKLNDLFGDRADDFLERLWSPAIVADANRGMQRSLGVGLNREAASKITKKAPVEIGGPQSLSNRTWNALRRKIETVKDGRRTDIDEHLANLLLKGGTKAGGKNFTAGEIINKIHKSVKQGKLPNDEARRLIIAAMQGAGTNDKAPQALEAGLLGALLVGGLGHRVGGAAVDIANPY
ncbi:hypothetical protein [Phyllobacterium sophorae]|uniref:Uncharacterized protein n=1 Tax=Phyllobacterium sophorae TaxID=1520277 RepID=A0A2P7BDX2_9HYPH|nr:hypothetical protein [Phyllobacterium sophorae]PSH64653.1 hypothetical protein CU103_12280 [Phyllobacterium sophorae]